jgi:hypothetical protein
MVVDTTGDGDDAFPGDECETTVGNDVCDKGTSAGLTGTLTTDKRGFARKVDNSGIVNATGGDGTDIGAFEFGSQ